MDECRLTIFTPVFNRAHCIGQCYRSMRRQKNQNFVWIIVDDGSTDHLEDVVRPWLKEGAQKFQVFPETERRAGVCLQCGAESCENRLLGMH